MNTDSVYPANMATALHEEWQKRNLDCAVLPSLETTAVLLDAMYQASLLREETEPIQCRIIVAPPTEFAGQLADGASQLQVLRFTEPCAMTPHQLRKLAAAAGYYRSLLVVDANSKPNIWGMAVTGTEWVNHVDGEYSTELGLPKRLVIHCIGPGHLIAASGFQRVLETSGGKLLTEGFDPFRSLWLPQRFGDFRERMLEVLDADQDHTPSPTQMCDSFVKDVAQGVVRRALRLVKNSGYGGMLVYLPEDFANSSYLDKWLRFRVLFCDDDSTLRFRRVMLALMKRARQVGQALGFAVVTYADYERMQDAELAQIEESLIEFAHLLADLMSVDGSLVLDRSFRLIGFGAEILGDSHVKTIHRGLDLEAGQTLVEPADSSGTRHRSAYRLVDGLKDALAVVVSQDGDVRFVAHHHGKLTYWPYLP